MPALVPIAWLSRARCALAAGFGFRSCATVHLNPRLMNFVSQNPIERFGNIPNMRPAPRLKLGPVGLITATFTAARNSPNLPGVSNSPNKTPWLTPDIHTHPGQPNSISPQHSPSASPECSSPIQLSLPSSPISVTSRLPDHNLPSSSRSVSQEFGRTRRIDSIFGDVKIVLVTKLENYPERKETLTLPRGETADKTYKYIEATAKRVRGEEDVPNDKELSLDDGRCKIICVKHKHKIKGSSKGKCSLAEERPLENPRDWKDIEALLQNYESEHLNHGNIVLIINRKLKIIPRYIPNAEMPQQQRAHWNLVHFNIKQKMKKVDGKSQKYMPNDEMQSFMTENIIRGLVKEEVDNLTIPANEVERITDRILHEAPKLLLMFVYGRIELRFMKILLEKGLNDKNLPFLEERPSWLPSGDDTDIGHFRDINDYDTVRQSQWPFLAVVFDKVQSGHRKLNPDAIVPFRKKEVRGSGAFSVVYRIELEESHQRLYELPRVSTTSIYRCISGTIDVPND
jgi:hypothetical protein